MRRRPDGSVQSSSTPTFQNVGHEDFSMYRCVVTKVKFTDDPSNVTQKAENPAVTYDCVILGGFAAGQILRNCRLSNQYGNNLNFEERILRPTTKKLDETPLSEHDGDIVYVIFNQASKKYPIIISCDQGTVTKDFIGAKKADGVRYIRQFNGIHQEINKDGEFILTRKGGEYDAEAMLFTPAEEAEYVKKLLKEEKTEETFKSGLKVLKSGVEDSIIQEFAGGLKVTHSGKDDKVEITTAGGLVVSVDGKGNKLTMDAGGTMIEVDGNSGKVSLKGDFVDLGASVSDFAVLFSQLLTAFNTHTHMVPQAPGGTLPSAPPMAPMLQTVASTTVKVQS